MSLNLAYYFFCEMLVFHDVVTYQLGYKKSFNFFSHKEEEKRKEKEAEFET